MFGVWAWFGHESLGGLSHNLGLEPLVDGELRVPDVEIPTAISAIGLTDLNCQLLLNICNRLNSRIGLNDADVLIAAPAWMRGGLSKHA